MKRGKNRHTQRVKTRSNKSKSLEPDLYFDILNFTFSVFGSLSDGYKRQFITDGGINETLQWFFSDEEFDCKNPELPVCLERDKSLELFINEPTLENFANLTSLSLLLDIFYFENNPNEEIAGDEIVERFNNTLAVIQLARSLPLKTERISVTPLIEFYSEQFKLYLNLAEQQCNMHNWTEYYYLNSIACAYRNGAEIYVINQFVPTNTLEESPEQLMKVSLSTPNTVSE